MVNLKNRQHNCRLSIVMGDVRPKHWTEAKWKREFRRRLEGLDLHAIYVIGPTGGPFKIGYAKDYKARLSSVAMAHWSHVIELQFFRWCSGEFIAKWLEGNVHAALAEKRIRGGWFNVTLDEAKAAIFAAAETEQVALFSQDGIDACMRQRREAELLKAVEC